MTQQLKAAFLILALFLFSTLPLFAASQWETEMSHAVLKADWKDIQEQARAWKRREPDSAIASWLEGYAALATDKYQLATERFRQLDKPKTAQQLQRWAEALVSKHSRSATAQMLYGDALARAGNYEQALGALTKAVNHSPDLALMYNVRGVVRALANQPEPARQDFEKAIELAPQFADAHANKGLLHLVQGQPAQAVTHFTDALKYAPDFALARNGRGLAFLSLQDYGDAVADIDHARRAFGTAPPPWLAFNQQTALRANARWGLSQHLAQSNSSGNGQSRPLAFDFDTQGRLTGMTDVFNQQTLYDYNSAGQLSRIVYPDGPKAEYRYNADGLLHEVHTEQGRRLQYTYGPRQEWMRVQFPNGDALQLEQDEQTRQVTVRYPDGDRVQYRYDAKDRLSHVQTPRGTGTLQYNASGHLKTVAWSDGRIVEFQYDKDNRLRTLIDGNGQKHDYWESIVDTNPQGRMVHVTDPLGRIQMDWDDAGRLRSATSDWGWKAKVHWDQDGKHPRSLTTSWGYVEFDEQGRPTDQFTLQGLRVPPSWDADERLDRIMTPFGGTIQMQYDTAGRPTRIQFPHGQDTHLRWNQQRRLTQVRDVRGMTSFHRDTSGRLQRLTSRDMHLKLRPLSSTKMARRTAYRYRHAMPPIHASRLLPSRHGRFWSRVQNLVERSSQLPLPSAARNDAYWTQGDYKQHDPYYREFIADVERFAEEMPDLDPGEFLRQQILTTGVIATDWARFGLEVMWERNPWLGVVVERIPTLVGLPMRQELHRYNREVLDEARKPLRIIGGAVGLAKSIGTLLQENLRLNFWDSIEYRPTRVRTTATLYNAKVVPVDVEAPTLVRHWEVLANPKGLLKGATGISVRGGLGSALDKTMESRPPQTSSSSGGFRPMTTQTFIVDGGTVHTTPALEVNSNPDGASQHAIYKPSPVLPIRFGRLPPLTLPHCAYYNNCKRRDEWDLFFPRDDEPPPLVVSSPPDRWDSDQVDDDFRRPPPPPAPTLMPQMDNFSSSGTQSYRLPPHVLPSPEMPRTDNFSSARQKSSERSSPDPRGGVKMAAEVVKNQPADMSSLFGSATTEKPDPPSSPLLNLQQVAAPFDKRYATLVSPFLLFPGVEEEQ